MIRRRQVLIYLHSGKKSIAMLRSGPGVDVVVPIVDSGEKNVSFPPVKIALC